MSEGENTDIPKVSDYVQAIHGAKASRARPVGHITTDPRAQNPKGR